MSTATAMPDRLSRAGSLGAERVVERRTGFRAGRGVPSAGAPAPPAALADPERFAAYVAHELRAPIALQRTLVEVTLADPDADTAALRAMGERVLASCERQQRLIEALLDLVRGRCGLRRREPVDLAAIAGEALRASDLRGLHTVVALEPARTSGDPDLLARLAANLVSNAIRHNLPRGRIEVATRAEPGRALLSVANSGRLIPAAQLERLFQPFQRLDSHPRTSADGVGLGLAVVEAIADAHGALVIARARAEGGLEVDVGFPATLDRGAAHRAAKCTAAANGTTPPGSTIGLAATVAEVLRTST
jgi:signal transduction histidine kinase